MPSPSSPPVAALSPPSARVGVIAWLRENLFSSLGNTLLTVLGLWLLYELVTAVLGWALFNAVWEGEDGSACAREHAGACWPYVSAWFGQFMYGRYPDAERWRVNLTYGLALAGLVPLMIPRVPGKLYASIYLFGVF